MISPWICTINRNSTINSFPKHAYKLWIFDCSLWSFLSPILHSCLGGFKAIARTVGHLAKSAEVMKLVNNLMKAPEVAVTMQEFSKEMTKVLPFVLVSNILHLVMLCMLCLADVYGLDSLLFMLNSFWIEPCPCLSSHHLLSNTLSAWMMFIFFYGPLNWLVKSKPTSDSVVDLCIHQLWEVKNVKIHHILV